MHLTVRLLGLDLLHFEISTEDLSTNEPGDSISIPIGYVAPPRPPREDQGREHE